MNLFSATQLTKSYGDKTLLDRLSFGIDLTFTVSMANQLEITK